MERLEIGFVVGLRAEAALLSGRGFAVGIGGGTPEGAANAARGLIAGGASALISFGLAGGLDPELRAGALVTPRAVLVDGTDYCCDAELLAFLGGVTAARIFAGAAIAATRAEKAALFGQTGAAAVDLESGAVARSAAQHGVPFAALRAVVDNAQCALPPAALVPLAAGGGIDLPGVAGSVFGHPGQIAGLIRLARDAARARRTLREALAAAAPKAG